MSERFQPMDEAIQTFIDQEYLCGAVAAVLKDGQEVHRKTWGVKSRETGEPMDDTTLFRIYSNTKPITSVAAMTLYEQNRFELDDPLERYLPELADLQVLQYNATSVTETEALASKPTVRQLMSHSAGFSYGIFQESPVDTLYLQRAVLNPAHTLEDMVATLAEIPLANQPGSRFQYSVSTDILARLIEVWSGKSFRDYLHDSIFEPLGMVDTDFHVPPEKVARFASVYAPVDVMDPLKPGLIPADDSLMGGYLEPRRFESGGGGLVSSVDDYLRFMQMLMADGLVPGADDVRLLRPETLELMRSNQLPEGKKIELPGWVMQDTVFGLGFAIKQSPASGEPEQAIGEYHWGGLAGTHTWLAPSAGIAGLIFTQRLPGFWDPFSHEFKRLTYQAMC